MESSIPKSTLHEAGKTPTTPSKGTDLAAVVDGGNGEVRCDSTPGQGVHVSFSTYAGCGTALSDKKELPKPEAMDTSTHSGRDWADIVSYQ